MDISLLLRVARVSLDISLHELSENTGISEKTIKSYEDGSSEPDTPRLIKLLIALQIPINEADIKEEDINIVVDDIMYTKRYERNNEKYFFGKCKCNREYFITEDDLNNPLRTKCKYCTAKEINESTIFTKLTREDIERLDTLYQNRIVKRSDKLGVKCTIGLQDYVKLITQDCYYCGGKPNQTDIINGKTLIHNGIDRLDNERGYEEDNVVPCCTTCNMAKGSLNEKEFISLIQRIYQNKQK